MEEGQSSSQDMTPVIGAYQQVEGLDVNQSWAAWAASAVVAIRIFGKSHFHETSLEVVACFIFELVKACSDPKTC